MKTIIIGGGTAGLAAAYTLKKNNIPVLILEKEEKAGGRIFGETYNNFILDMGAQFFFRYYDTTFRLCQELGLKQNLESYHFQCALWRDGCFSPMIGGIRPEAIWKNRKNMFGFKQLGLKAKIQSALIMLKVILRRKDIHFINNANALDLDTLSIAEFIKNEGDEELLEYLFQPLISCLTLGEPEDVSAAYGLALFWYSLNGLWTLKGGIGSLATALQDSIGDNIKRNHHARKIIIENNQVKGVETDKGFFEATSVICATPATAAVKLLQGGSSGIDEPLKKIRYSTCCHVMSGHNGQILPEGWYSIALPRKSNSSVAGFSNNAIKSEYYSPENCSLIHCYTYGSHAKELNQLPDEKIKTHILKEAERYIPDFSTNKAVSPPLFTVIKRWDEAVCLSSPGMISAIHKMKTNNHNSIEGLFLAGEYMYMPSVDGALKSGMDAAQKIIDRFPLRG